jgi:predicted nucleic acid-binding protein
MRVCFDTSVLVPALVAAHPLHARALCWVQAAATKEIEGVMAWHAAAETWSVLTRLPVSPHVTAGAAAQMVERLVQHVRPLAMTPALYRKTIQRCAERGAGSGAIFDALHLVAAEVSRSDVLVTLNPDDFERLAGERGPRIIVPPAPPRVTAR